MLLIWRVFVLRVTFYVQLVFLISMSLTCTVSVMSFRVARWLSGRASDLRSSSRGFEARP